MFSRGVLVVKYPKGVGGQFDPGFYFEPWTPKMGTMTKLTILVFFDEYPSSKLLKCAKKLSIVVHIWPSEDLGSFGAPKKVKI